MALKELFNKSSDYGTMLKDLFDKLQDYHSVFKKLLHLKGQSYEIFDFRLF